MASSYRRGSVAMTVRDLAGTAYYRNHIIAQRRYTHCYFAQQKAGKANERSERAYEYVFTYIPPVSVLAERGKSMESGDGTEQAFRIRR